MNEEEKKYIEWIKQKLKSNKEMFENQGVCLSIDYSTEIAIKQILNLIEKQSKEIEELKEQNINLVQEKIIDENSTKPLPNFYDYYDVISKQKIKDKIEELNKYGNTKYVEELSYKILLNIKKLLESEE